ncbi:hypothetical protein F5Y04DRAFT_255002, partial [Hypomontagnella monticulosa]
MSLVTRELESYVGFIPIACYIWRCGAFVIGDDGCKLPTCRYVTLVRPLGIAACVYGGIGVGLLTGFL